MDSKPSLRNQATQENKVKEVLSSLFFVECLGSRFSLDDV